MRVTILIILILAFCFRINSIAQQDQLPADNDQLEVTGEQEETSADFNDVKPKKLHPHLEVGTSFTYSPNYFYGPSYYIAPGFSYAVTPRFYLLAGIAIEHSTFYPLYSQGRDADNILPMTRAFMYAKGSYLLTPRLTINGTVYKSINDVPGTAQHSYPYNYNYQGMSVGLRYKISNSFSFGFQVRTQNGYYNPPGLIPREAYVPVPGF